MSWNATADGTIKLNCSAESIPDDVIELGNKYFTEIELSPDGGLWLTLEYEDYNEPDEFLKYMIPYTKSGCVQYTGEDGSHWAYEFRNGKWEYMDGEVVYKPHRHIINVEFQREDPVDGLIDDETQFDIEDADFPTMWAELNMLFNDFREENGWSDKNCWISTIEEVT